MNRRRTIAQHTVAVLAVLAFIALMALVGTIEATA